MGERNGIQMRKEKGNRKETGLVLRQGRERNRRVNITKTVQKWTNAIEKDSDSEDQERSKGTFITGRNILQVLYYAGAILML